MPTKPTYAMLEARVRTLEACLSGRQADRPRQTPEAVQTVIDLLPGMIFAQDGEGRFLLANRALADCYGTTVDALLGRRHADIHPDAEEVAGMLAHNDAVLAHGRGPVVREERFRDPSGRRRWLQTTKVPFIDPTSAAPAILCVAIDITGRREAETALEDRETALGSIFRAAPTGIGTVKDRIIRMANARLCEMVGYTREELIDRDARMLYPTEAEYDAVGVEKYRQIERSGTGTVETRWRRKNGDFIDVLLSSTPIDPAHPSRGITFTAQDITDRKRMETVLRRSEARLRAIFQAIPDPVVVYDTNGHPRYLNPAFTALFGWTLASLKGCRIPFVPPHQRKITAEKIEEIYRTGRPLQFETQRYTRERRLRDCLIHAALIHGSGGQADGMVVHLTDITERKKLEWQLRQVQKLEAIGQLAGGIAHDFNNMLAPILGYSELLLEDLHPSDARHRQVLEIKKAAEHSRDLTRQLLAMSRNQDLDLKALDLRDVFQGIEKILARTLREDVRLRLDMPPEPCVVRADVGRLEQVLINLAVNAQDAMPNGGDLDVTLSRCLMGAEALPAMPTLSPGTFIRLSVSDTGVGMDEDTRRHIFDPFFTTKGPKGTGLGLATVYGIIQQHKGGIQVSSSPGQGTTFHMLFPEATGAAPVEAAAPECPPIGGFETVLVVEDNPMVRELVCTVLERHGFRAVFADGGDQALDLAARLDGPPHLLLTDVVMPGMNGKTLFQRLSGIFPGLRVLFMSGHTENVIAEFGGTAGGVHYIQKPFTIQGLTAKIRMVLAGP